MTAERTPSAEARRVPPAVLALLIATFVVVSLHNTWLSDDAFITVRTIDNWFHGHGLRWNVSERVQSFTHPLWMLALSSAHALTGEFYFAPLGLCLLLSTVAVAWCMSRLAISITHAVIATTMLVLSRAFMDFSSGGLENPLTHLLLVLLGWAWFTLPQGRGRARWLMALHALLMLNRLDAALLAAPMIAAEAFRQLRRHETRALLRDGLRCYAPLLLWLLFALIYFGFALPNTYYAKVNTDVDGRVRVAQGLLYLTRTLNVDPITAFALCAALVFAAWPGAGAATRIWMIGPVLYLIYTARLGGDFMEGRFLSAPFTMAVIALSRAPLHADEGSAEGLIALALVTLVGVTGPHPPPLTDGAFGEGYGVGNFVDGIADEHAFFAPGSAITGIRRGDVLPKHPWFMDGRRDSHQALAPKAELAIGYYGYGVGPGLHIVDKMGLADPLLARLPAVRDLDWRPGHHVRHVPEGYLTSIAETRNALTDPKLARFYAALQRVVSGPIWSWQRWLDMWRFHVGSYDHLVDHDRYRLPERKVVTEQAIHTPVKAGTPRKSPGVRKLTQSGIDVQFAAPRHCRRIEVSLDSDDHYEITFFHQPAALETIHVRPSHGGEMQPYTLNVPLRARTDGFDVIRVLPMRGADWAIGHLHCLDP